MGKKTFRTNSAKILNRGFIYPLLNKYTFVCQRQIKDIKRYKYNTENLQKQFSKESNYLYLHKQASHGILWHMMGSLGKKARQKPLTERAENPQGQPPYVNQGVLSAGKLQDDKVIGSTGGKMTASNHLYLDQPCTSRPWEEREEVLLSESVLSAGR